MANLAILISCEHGGNEVPPPYADCFQGHDDLLASHRGWDIGALAVAERLAALLATPLFFTTVSRLLVDCNRSPHHRALFSEISRALPQGDRTAILDRHYHPHRERIRAAIGQALTSGQPVLHLAIHSFTPLLAGQERRAGLGLLHDSRREDETRLCRDWQTALKKARPNLGIRRNYPYRGQSDGLATWLRGQLPQARYLGVEVEINQRLLTHFSPTLLAGLLAQTLLPCLREPPPQPTDPGAEEVVIVDAENQVTGQAKRREMRRQNLTHRATYILVFNQQGQLFVQKRTLSKDIYPGYYDIAAGGVVLSSETYEESARRELHEELGITAELEFLFERYFADDTNKVWGRVYRCRHEGPFALQESEVESGAFMTPAEIMASPARFTPDGLAILAELMAGRSVISP